MGKRKLVLLTTFVILFLIIVLGVYSVFTVNGVSVYYAVVSESGLAYTQELQEKLDDLCKGKNIFFISEKKVAAVFDEFPYVSELSIRKVYPNKLVVYAEENLERFAVWSDSGNVYDMLDKTGVKLGERAENSNNADGFRNILLENFSYDRTAGAFADGDLAKSLFAMCDYMETAFDGVRTNIGSIAYRDPVSLAEESYFEIGTAEGVIINIKNPTSLTEEKIAAACECYLSLAKIDRLYGTINVVELKEGEGEISVSYTNRYGEVS